MNLRILFFLLVSPLILRGNSAAMKTAQEVLDNLYETNGNFIFQKPELTITDDEKNAALFMRRANRIEVSERAIKVCRSFGQDSLDALAFLIGHELAHSYKSKLIADKTSFLAYDKFHSEGIELEEGADLHGLFMAYLSGYKTLELVPKIIERIYEEFELKNKILKNYPTLDERKNSAQKVVEIADELIKIFEAGNHLLAIGKYELAGACFEHVEQYYNGRELYNNLGICYALSALNFSETNSEPFLFPLEINWTTRLKKPKGKRGGADLQPENRHRRAEFLEKAADCFLKSAKMDTDFLTAKLNMFCTLVLQGETGQAIDFYKKNNLLKAADARPNNSEIAKEKIRLAFALAIYDIEKIAAERIWKNLSKSKNYFIARQAIHNLKTGKGIPFFQQSDGTDCHEFASLNKTVDEVKLHRPFGTFKPLAGTRELEFSITQKENSLTYFFKKQGRVIFSLQRVFERPNINFSPPLEGIFTDRGFISVCDLHRISLVTEDDNLVKEWAKYFGMD